jgi:pimeloyl-ACP methyl ester carboxylesterase
MTDPTVNAASIADRLRGALADPEIRLAQKGLGETIALDVGGDSLALVRVDGEYGEYGVVRPAPAGCTVALRAPREVWQAALRAKPAPGEHSITALRRSGRVTVEGDPAAFARSLHLLERALELIREKAPPLQAPPVARDPGQIAGRYHRITSRSGGTAVVYGESAGRGPPILMLHTAGADSRQFHALLSDVELARRWTLHAFDLPMHGRSMPQESWDGGAWVLTQEGYRDWCRAYLEQVIGEPAVVMGCSIGAAMVLVLAADLPELVRGVVALEPPFRSHGRQSPVLTHAGVNASAHNPSYVRGLMSPLASVSDRRAAAWIYAQGGLGVYSGDIEFYEHFDGEAVARRIDGRKCPVALLSGAYDYSATPEDGRRIAALIPGATVKLMPDLGHFPMIEAPDCLRTYLAPVLDDLAARLAGGKP